LIYEQGSKVSNSSSVPASSVENLNRGSVSKQEESPDSTGASNGGQANGSNNFLSNIKYTLNNSDIPYIDQNHPVYSLCEVDNFVITGHAMGYITMWETLYCGKRVINQYLPCIDKSFLNQNWSEN